LTSVCKQTEIIQDLFFKVEGLKNQGRVIRSRGGPTHRPEEFIGCDREELRQMSSLISEGEKGANAGDGSSFPASSQVDLQEQLAVPGPSILFLQKRLMGS